MNHMFEEETYMKLSEEAVLKFHNALFSALQEDDALPIDKKESGVREYPDFRQQGDVIESVLRKRNISFTPLKWQ